MAKPTTWLLVADAGHARVYTVDADTRRIERVPLLEFDAPTPKSREIASDRPGRTFDRVGDGRHAKAPPTDPLRYEKERFAREVAHRLERAATTGAFDRLVVVAAPAFLGDLRAVATPPLASRIAQEVAKDLVHVPPHELDVRLGEVLRA